PAGFFLPADARPHSASLDHSSLVPMDEVFHTLSEKVNCHHSLLILDCCFAGKFRFVGNKSRAEDFEEVAPTTNLRFARYKEKSAWQVLVSAGPDETAADWMGTRINRDDWGEEIRGFHSPFAVALIRGLRGQADAVFPARESGDGVITMQELYLYIWDQLDDMIRGSGFELQHPGLFPMGQHGGGTFVFFNPEHEEIKIELDPVPTNPYKGLSAFMEDDAHLYFGRKAAVEELYGKMYGQGQAAEPQLWVVAAPSGTGKSSFVKAGLTPVLKAKQGFEELLVFRPGATPARSWRLFHQNLKPEKKQILLLDQYEELFTACKDETERRLFDQKMLALLESEAFQQGNLCIFIALRSDYEWQLEASAFGQKLFERQRTAFIFRPPAMGLDELRQALTGPARAAVFDFESPALVDGILAEIANAPGALPLLSFTMSEFFQRTVKANEEILNKLEGRIFTESRYHELGGVSGALSRRADRLLEELGGEASSPTHQYFRELMIRLVDVRNGTFIRRRVYRGHMDGPAAVPDELEFDDASKNEALEVIISRLVEEQLLIASEADGKPYLEAAHDSLINYWPACLRWLEDFGEEQLVLQRRLWEATVESYREGQLYLTKREEDVSQFFSRSAELMLANLTQLWESRPELEVLKAVLENAAPGHWFNQEERCFVEASLKRRQRIVEQLKRERDEARASALSAKGLLAYPDHPTRALNLAQYAYLTLPGEEAAGAIRQITAVSHQNMYYQGHKQHQATINALALAPAGQKFASAGNDKRVILWDLGPRNSTQYTAKELVGNPAGEAVRHSSRVEALAWSPTGHYFVSGGRDNRLIVWDEDGNYLLHHDIPRTSVRRGITGLSISHDGRRMLSTGVDGMVRLWQIQLENGLPASLEQQHEEAHLTGMWISAVDFSSDGKRFVTGGGDPLPLVLWEVVEETAHSTFRRIHEFGPIDPSLVDPKARVTSVAFAPDGTHVLTSDSHFQVIAWTLDGQFQQRDVFKHHTAAVNKVRFYQGSANFISAGMDEAFVLWQQDRENGPEYVQKLAYKGHLRSIMDVVVAPEGRLIAAGEKGEVYVYDTPLYLEADIQFSGISSLKISPSGRYLSTASRITEEEQGGEESSIHQLALIDLHTKGADGKQLLLHLPHEGHVFDSCFSPDGNWLLSACMDAKVHLWAQTQANGGHEWIHKGEMPHPQAVRTVACFEAGEKLMVLTGSNTDMHLWSIEANTQSGEVALPRLLSTHSHEDLLWSIACTRDGAAIVSAGGRDATLWKAATHGEELRLEQLTLLDEHAHNIRSVAISPDGMRVLTADERQQVVLWLLKHEEGSAEVDETIFLNGHTSLNDAGHVAVSFSPDGQHILTAGQDKRAFLWDLAGNQLQVFEKPNEEANANQSISFFKALCGACFSPDGLGIYTRNIGSQAEGVSLCSWENYVKKWEAGLIYQLNEDEKRQYGMIVEKIQR
ncbi:MAG: WD40 repeat domain-containing protein, partial [Bacteroidetes bacterium]